MTNGTVSNSLKKLASSLELSNEQSELFIERILKQDARCPCVLWVAERPTDPPFVTLPRHPLIPCYIDVIEESIRPGKHELHEQGAYYCLDAGSIFETIPFIKAANSGGIVLDVCSSPGGKSVSASVGLHPSLLVSNEVVGKRLGQLRANIRRCKIANVFVTNFKTEDLVERISGVGNLVIVDAPCSGQSLVARGLDSPGCFLPHVIRHNAMRQRRILSTSAKLAAPGALVAYMTCTYSPEENERVAEWFLKRHKEFEAVAISDMKSLQSHLTTVPCYRAWPWSDFGAGGFTALFRRKGEALPPADPEEVLGKLQC